MTEASASELRIALFHSTYRYISKISFSAPVRVRHCLSGATLNALQGPAFMQGGYGRYAELPIIRSIF